jgi:hypothetical protein
MSNMGKVIVAKEPNELVDRTISKLSAEPIQRNML